jgi:prolyl-tRNA synthetase
MEAVGRISAELKAAGIRVKIDDRDNLSPGYKFNDWELRGVPTRIEIGPRDVAQNSVALARRDIPTRAVTNYEQFQEAVQTGFARVWWAGTNEEENRIKEETKATIRCFPLDQPSESGRCFYTGRPTERMAIFGRAY